MWWLGHLFLIFCVFGLGFATRELIIAYKALEQWFVYGSEDPATFVERSTKPRAVPVPAAPSVEQTDAFASMQSKADSDKLRQLKAAMKTK